MKITTALLAAVLVAVTVVDGFKLRKKISVTSTSIAAAVTRPAASAPAPATINQDVKDWLSENDFRPEMVACLGITQMEDMKLFGKPDEIRRDCQICDWTPEEEEKFVIAVEAYGKGDEDLNAADFMIQNEAPSAPVPATVDQRVKSWVSEEGLQLEWIECLGITEMKDLKHMDKTCFENCPKSVRKDNDGITKFMTAVKAYVKDAKICEDVDDLPFGGMGCSGAINILKEMDTDQPLNCESNLRVMDLDGGMLKHFCCKPCKDQGLC